MSILHAIFEQHDYEAAASRAGEPAARIETVADLDALPVGSVVRLPRSNGDSNGDEHDAAVNMA